MLSPAPAAYARRVSRSTLRVLGSFLLALSLSACPADSGSDDAGAGGDAATSDAAAIDAAAHDAAVPRDAGECATNDDCADDLFCTDRERCVAGRCTFQDTYCDDGVECTMDSCSEERRRCENVAPDRDGDGSRDATCRDYRGVPLGDDCDDADATRFPSNVEVCDAVGHDEDCDLATYGGVDADHDGYLSEACCQIDAEGLLRCGDDCNDAVGSTHPLAGEVCNGIDDDCDDLDDDIIHGNVLCARGDGRPCTTSCGVAGTEACNAACLGWDTCAAAEVCNGCDDDNDAAQDEDFECALGTSRTCTTTCGTSGTQLCGSTCSYTQCSASEACNYCDDDGDGNFFEERPLATVLATDTWTSCDGSLFGDAHCMTEDPPNTVLVYTELMDGSANNQAGAMWLDTGAMMGWGPVELEVTMELSGRTAGGMNEMPLGGWAIVVARGNVGVGTPADSGIPRTMTGVAARWFWTQLDSCFGFPPSSGDAIRSTQLDATGIRALTTTNDMTTTGSCQSGYGLIGGATTLDGPGQNVSHRMRLRYTPDDPTTAPNEESMVVTAIAGTTTMQQVIPFDAIPVGTGPLRVGITAGSYTARFPSAGPFDVGMPVRARVLVQRVDIHCCRPATVTYPVQVQYTGTCPR